MCWHATFVCTAPSRSYRRSVSPTPPGRTQRTVNRIEARKANPTVETLAKIAAALRVEVDALFVKPERGR